MEAGLTGFLNVRYLPVRVAYPYPVKLSFQLPVGDVTEGGVEADAVVSGTLRLDHKPIAEARLCLLTETGSERVTCGLTNQLGEYALSVPPGRYRVRVQTTSGQERWSHLDASRPGWHWNELELDGSVERPKQR